MAATNFSCGISPVTSVGPVCGGNGQCVFSAEFNRGICICNAGWQGESDFQVTNSYLDCQINVTAIRALWGVALALFLIIFFSRQLPRARWLWNKHQGTVQRSKQVGKKYRIWDNKGFFAIIPCLVLGFPAMCTMAIVKMADQDLKIGNSVLVTILYIIWRTTFVFAPDSKFQFRFQRKQTHTTKISNRRCLPLYYGLSVTWTTLYT